VSREEIGLQALYRSSDHDDRLHARGNGRYEHDHDGDDQTWREVSGARPPPVTAPALA
jgi:hypothetical protein